MKLLAALLSVTAAVGNAADINPLIVGGTVVPAGTKEYTVGLRSSAAADAQCGGSLISPTHVLTAGHCAGFAKYVSIGSHYLGGSRDGERIRVLSETPHPRFNENTMNYDYAIIELARASSYTPIKLLSDDSETFIGSMATVMGWGDTVENGTQSNVLLRANVKVLSDANCRTKGLESFPLSKSMFCAGGVVNKDSCQGDSGGPLILEQTDEDLLVGVVSWGDGCGARGKPGVYSKVSYVKSWIQQNAPEAEFV